MFIKMLRAKIHRATVTDANVDYVGSITIDQELCKAAGILEHEQVLVADLDNAQRFETYVLYGKAGSGVICVNGAAARLVRVGDKVIIMGFAYVTDKEAADLKPNILLVDDKNIPATKL